jgi:hypothetical protein
VPDTRPPLEERLERALKPSLTSAQHAALDARLAAVIEERPAHRRRVLRRSLLLVGLLMIVVPTVFAVSGAVRSTEAPYGMGNANGLDAELRAAKAQVPLPAGATWPPYLDGATDRSASYGVGMGRQMVEFNAYCLWLGDWYQAQAAGNGGEGAAAIRVLQQARSWTTFTDPLITDQGLRDHVQAVVAAAVRGDGAPVLRELELNCSGTWSPAADGSRPPASGSR